MKVLTVGTFDLFHLGHLRLLNRCKNLAVDDKLVIGVNTCEFVEKYKGVKPIMNYHERSELIRQMYPTASVMPNDSESLEQMILDNDIDIIVIGNDWLVKDYLKQIGTTREFLCENDVSILYVPHTEGISSTLIKERLKK